MSSVSEKGYGANRARMRTTVEGEGGKGESLLVSHAAVPKAPGGTAGRSRRRAKARKEFCVSMLRVFCIFSSFLFSFLLPLLFVPSIRPAYSRGRMGYETFAQN